MPICESPALIQHMYWSWVQMPSSHSQRVPLYRYRRSFHRVKSSRNLAYSFWHRFDQLSQVLSITRSPRVSLGSGIVCIPDPDETCISVVWLSSRGLRSSIGNFLLRTCPSGSVRSAFLRSLFLLPRQALFSFLCILLQFSNNLYVSLSSRVLINSFDNLSSSFPCSGMSFIFSFVWTSSSALALSSVALHFSL